jgi:hypothetical protein
VPARDSDAQFHYVTVVKDVVPTYQLSIVDATTPDTGHFEIFEEILMDLTSEFFNATTLFQQKGRAEIRVSAGRF